MDSISQAVLGAAVGQLTLGKQWGRRAALAGAVLATIPDLDVLVPYSNPVDDFTRHRSVTHSLLVHAACSPLLAWVMARSFKSAELTARRCTLFVFAVLSTHALLDAFTVYGTQLFWPLPFEPVGLASVFIIDPLYTAPLLWCAWILARRPSRERAQRVAGRALLVSSAYLVWTVVAQQITLNAAQRSLRQMDVQASALLASPAPLQSMLWRLVAVDGDDYWEGYDSLLDGTGPRWRKLPRNRQAIAPLNAAAAVERLDWFTDGFWAASMDSDGVVVADLRMGTEPSYVFRFRVGRYDSAGRLVAIEPEKLPVEFRPAGLGQMLRRIVNPDAFSLSKEDEQS